MRDVLFKTFVLVCVVLDCVVAVFCNCYYLGLWTAVRASITLPLVSCFRYCSRALVFFCV